MDESRFVSLLKVSNVLTNKEFLEWNFSAILELMETFLLNKQRFNQAIQNKFIKKVVNFYQPSRRAFVLLGWKVANFVHVKVGFQLLKLCLKSREGRKLLTVTDASYKVKTSFFQDMTNLLKSTNNQNLNNNNDSSLINNAN